MDVALRRSLMAAFIVSSFCPTLMAHADEELPEPTVEETPTQSESEDAPPSDRAPRIKVHDLGIGYHAVLFRTQSGDRYSLNGPTIVYNYFIGRRFGFVLRGAVHIPMFGRMSGGPSGDFRGGLNERYSGRQFGFDGLFGVGRRFFIGEHLAMQPALGVHIQSFTINGETVSPVEAITFGLAGTFRLDYRPVPGAHIGFELLVGLDPLDLIKHQNRATLTIPLAGVVSIGFEF